MELGDPLGGPIDEEGNELSPPSPTLLQRGRDSAGHLSEILLDLTRLIDLHVLDSRRKSN